MTWLSVLIDIGNNREKYTAIHPYTSAIPVLVYILVRNGPKPLRQTVCMPFVAAGKLSLELYMLQHHVWLAADASKVLRTLFFFLQCSRHHSV